MSNDTFTTTSRKDRPSSLKTAAIIGRGKISGHLPSLFKNHFDSFTWLEKNTNYSVLELSHIDVVILAVQDKKIEDTYNKLKDVFPKDVQFIHLSGAQSFSGIIGLHPLMTFSEDSKIQDYNEIPLFTDNLKFFEEHKNNLKNLKFISSDLKTKYHAMAVMLGNFSQYYLQQVKNSFPEDLCFEEYKLLTLSSIENIFNKKSKDMLTGPLVRNDLQTIEKHKNELERSEPNLFRVYQVMESMFRQELFKDED